MGTCVSKCYSSDPFIHLDSDQLKDKLVVSETSPPLPPTSSVSSSSAASVSSPNPTTHSAFSSSSPPSSSSSSSFAAPSAESSSKKPLPSAEINPIISVDPRWKEAESQSDRKRAPPAPRATKQQPLVRTSTVPTPGKRARSCSPAAVAERRSFAGSTHRGAASPPRVPRSRSLAARKESVRWAANPGRASSMNRGGIALMKQTDSQVFQKGSNSVVAVGQNVAVEELDNPLISMDCFIFI